jgi:hypothetical protein
MKEKPIIFSTPMVQALLNTKPGTWPAEPIDAGRPFKFMTRRVIKPQPIPPKTAYEASVLETLLFGERRYSVGDILWVRETFTKTEGGEYIYRSDPMFDGMGKGDFAWSWTSPLFLPRKAARIFLELKGVRIERLQNITKEDARAEGAEQIDPFGLKKLPSSLIEPGGAYGKGFIPKKSYRAGFYQIWDTLNAKRGYSWDNNPWVWVYELMRVG